MNKTCYTKSGVSSNFVPSNRPLSLNFISGITSNAINDNIIKGASNRSLKVHNRIDPEIPDFATHVIIVVGADVVNTKLSDGKVHRSDMFAKVWKVDIHFTLDVEFITKVVTSKTGYLSKVPNNPTRIYFVNKRE